MVDTTALDLANFLARNRAAGGVNRQLADALAMNLMPQETPDQMPARTDGPSFRRGLFGLGGEPGERGDLGGGFRGGGSLLNLAGFLAGPASFPAAALGSLVASNALGLPLSISPLQTIRSISRGGGDSDRRGQVSRSDRIRSASNREAGGGFVE